ncbi:Imm51 family immunity protein [Psychrobacter sp. I-STPA6b]|uniref:Imm51 family immunity protein n=1 Tax=Psychrobacter sp. I-STPA6b TaxID=2585718 RepID=UPI001D0C0132|nr:Imm51 family immunity protein [Psychrobacter sp. I-STPA6b]
MDNQQQQEFEQQIAPFFWVEHDSSVSLCMSDVGDYKMDIFNSRAEEGFMGNGYDWGSLATVFIEEKHPEWQEVINFDPEAGMFCVYTDIENKAVLKEFALAFKRTLDNNEVILDLFSRAELD